MLRLRTDVCQTSSKALQVAFLVGARADYRENRLTKELVVAPGLNNTECYNQFFEFVYSLNGKTYSELLRGGSSILQAIQAFLLKRTKQKAVYGQKPASHGSPEATYSLKVTIEKVKQNFSDPNGFVPICYFPMYEIRCDGTIRDRNSQAVVPLRKTEPGEYPKIALKEGSKPKQVIFLHRLVATHFVENPERKNEVDHIDDNKEHYHWSNLKWVTQAENNAKCQIRGRRLKRKEPALVEFYNRVNLSNHNIRPSFRVLDDMLAFVSSVSGPTILQSLQMNVTDFLQYTITNSTPVLQYLVQPISDYKSHNQLPGEIWKDVHDVLGIAQIRIASHIQVSNLGRFRNWQGDTLHNNNRFLFGYAIATIEKKQYLLHEVVAMAFLKDPDMAGGTDSRPLNVFHKNGKTYDNRAVNLQWETDTETESLAPTRTPLLRACKLVLDELNQYESCIPYVTATGKTKSPFSSLIATYMSTEYPRETDRADGLFEFVPM